MSALSPGKVLAISGSNTRRFLRDRTNLFFVFVFPVALILILGAQFGGNPDPRLGVVGADGATAGPLLDLVRAETAVNVIEVDGEQELVDRVESTDLHAGVVLPTDLASAVAAGERAGIGFVAGNTPAGQQLRTVVDEALAQLLVEPTAVRAAVERGADPTAAADAAARLAPAVEVVTVRTETAGERLFPEGTEGFDVAAPSQLVLFTFINGLTGAYALILSRQLGVSRRMLSTPTSMGTILTGEAVARWLISLIQGLYILAATLILFRVDWGDPLGALAVVAAIAAAAAGAAMCFGAFFDQPEQASGIGIVVGLGLAALGGAMVPIELFSDTLSTVARLTPHFWAIDAFAELIRHDATILDILPQLGVLVAMAAALTALATWRLRAVLTR